MNRVLRIFFDTDMRNNHLGLASIAKAKSINLHTLEPGEHVIFVNAARNRLKTYSKGDLITYKVQDKGRLDMNAFSEIAQAFNPSGHLNFDKALKESLLKRLGNVK